MERNTAETQLSPHGFSVQDREKLSVSGVRDVVNFDENQIVITTGMGTLVVSGSSLHVDQLSLDTGELRITGQLDGMDYDDTAAPGGLLHRLFR